MGTIKIMDDIPNLSHDLANWCMRVVHFIACSDGIVSNSEKNILNDLSNYLGVSFPSENTTNIEPPPPMTEEQKEYLLRMIFLTSWIDGNFCETERFNVSRCLQLLNIDKDRSEIAHLKVRKAIFISSIVSAIEEIVSSSEICNAIINQLQLSEEDVKTSLCDWRRRI